MREKYRGKHRGSQRKEKGASRQTSSWARVCVFEKKKRRQREKKGKREKKEHRAPLDWKQKGKFDLLFFSSVARKKQRAVDSGGRFLGGAAVFRRRTFSPFFFIVCLLCRRCEPRDAGSRRLCQGGRTDAGKERGKRKRGAQRARSSRCHLNSWPLSPRWSSEMMQPVLRPCLAPTDSFTRCALDASYVATWSPRDAVSFLPETVENGNLVSPLQVAAAMHAASIACTRYAIYLLMHRVAPPWMGPLLPGAFADAERKMDMLIQIAYLFLVRPGNAARLYIQASDLPDDAGYGMFDVDATGIDRMTPMVDDSTARLKINTALASILRTEMAKSTPNDRPRIDLFAAFPTAAWWMRQTAPGTGAILYAPHSPATVQVFEIDVADMLTNRAALLRAQARRRLWQEKDPTKIETKKKKKKKGKNKREGVRRVDDSYFGCRKKTRHFFSLSFSTMESSCFFISILWQRRENEKRGQGENQTLEQTHCHRTGTEKPKRQKKESVCGARALFRKKNQVSRVRATPVFVIRRLNTRKTTAKHLIHNLYRCAR